ncbi:lachrymatory-factor synthase [Andrographis paniculata]|uniref:lachrymatory-factor synthase n=1 Tax=Andrographis paniculata TaxID=175694 RepID=UPI0021E823F1|nr:lachrymatory-factor synthase [Andrographis paniculata]
METTTSAEQQKWEATVRAAAEKATAEQLWPLFEDFFGLHKWFPGLQICRGVAGANGEPGCIRYCAGFKGIKPQSESSPATAKATATATAAWSKERLRWVDRRRMTLSYEIVDSNIGFTSYVSTVRVTDGAAGGAAAVVEWSITVDPVAGLELADLAAKYRVGLEAMVKNMEAAIVAGTSIS